MLVYPEERKREKIVLTQEKEEEMEKIILDIQNLVSQTLPPPVVIKPYCRRCTYYEMCMV
jgi:CRISPR-associated exonuclease Cas4